MLNRFTADAINRAVIAGPDEGTVIGNVLVQAMGVGALKDVAALRRVVEASFPTRRLEPENATAWDAAYAKYLEMVGTIRRDGLRLRAGPRCPALWSWPIWATPSTTSTWRARLVREGGHVRDMHRAAVRRVCAHAQAEAFCAHRGSLYRARARRGPPRP